MDGEVYYRAVRDELRVFSVATQKRGSFKFDSHICFSKKHPCISETITLALAHDSKRIGTVPAGRRQKMAEPPLSIIRLEDAEIIRISPSTVTADAAHFLENLLSALPSPDVKIHVIKGEDGPPWEKSNVAELVNESEAKQFILLCDSLTPYAVAFALMVLEKGYDLFVVTEHFRGDDHFGAERLQKAGATLMGFKDFLEECALTARSIDCADSH